MRGYVDQHMEPPCSEFPERPLQEKPNQQKREEKDDEAVGDIVQMVHIVRDRRFRRCAVTEVGSLCQSEHDRCPQNSK